jgi:hypothetical protein
MEHGSNPREGTKMTTRIRFLSSAFAALALVLVSLRPASADGYQRCQDRCSRGYDRCARPCMAGKLNALGQALGGAIAGRFTPPVVDSDPFCLQNCSDDRADCASTCDDMQGD